MVVQGVEANDLKVSKFRESLKYALIRTFIPNFTDVKFIDNKTDTGICLVIYRVHPLWKYGASYSNYNAVLHSTSSNNRISAVFQYESTLFKNGQKIMAADGECTSNGSCSDESHLAAIFIDGTQVMCEEINRSLFRDAIVQKLRNEK